MPQLMAMLTLALVMPSSCVVNMDDNGSGPNITLATIPYASYTAIIYMATDQGGTSNYNALTVNGASTGASTGTKQQYGTTPTWDSTNSFTVTGLSGDLTVTGPVGTTNTPRSSIAGIQIIDTTPVPEPSSTALLGLGGLALILRRRK